MKKTCAAIALPLVLATAFNSPASANLAGYDATVQDFTALYGAPVAYTRYNEDGTSNDELVFHVDDKKAIRIQHSTQERSRVNYILTYMPVYGNDVYSTDYFDFMQVDFEDGGFCVANNNLKINYRFDAAPSYSDLSHLQLSVAEVRDLYLEAFERNLNAHINALMMTSTPDDIGRDINALGDIFFPVSRQTVQEMETVYGISFHSPSFVGSGQSYITRTPNQSCRP